MNDTEGRLQRIEKQNEKVNKDLLHILRAINKNLKTTEESESEDDNDVAPEWPLFRWYEQVKTAEQPNVLATTAKKRHPSPRDLANDAEASPSAAAAPVAQEDVLNTVDSANRGDNSHPAAESRSSSQLSAEYPTLKEQNLLRWSRATGWWYRYESPYNDTNLWITLRSEGLGTSSSTENATSGLGSLIGDLWAVPDDARISLSFYVEALGRYQGLRDAIEWHDPELARFPVLMAYNADLVSSFNDATFSVIDFDPWHYGYMTYGSISKQKHRSAETSMRSLRPCKWGHDWDDEVRTVLDEYKQNISGNARYFEPFVVNKDSLYIREVAPWRRLIIVEGLGSLGPYDAAKDPAVAPECPFIETSYSTAITTLLKNYGRCSRSDDGKTSNSYLDDNPFHLVFFEKDCSPRGVSPKSQWKHGMVFHDGKASTRSRGFRRSAFGIYVSPILQDVEDGHHPDLDPLYTVLLLIPENFFEDDVTFRNKIYDVLSEETRIHVTMFCILFALNEIVKRWTSLNEYLGELLEDDFMDPQEYSKLLFDDANFTRSRKYFWSIAALTEFDISVTENIKQWDLFYNGRIKPLLKLKNIVGWFDASSLTKDEEHSTHQNGSRKLQSFKDQIKEAQKHREMLVGLRDEFRSKLERVKALRDGLFNASALVESRASTRLGENVKLLTYVSIFYLPLAFCATLWAVPNILDKATKVPFMITSILLGFVTYAVVFNFNSIAGAITSIYSRRRKVLVSHMQRERGWWKMQGNGFQEFKPANEDTTPTEWLIPVYAIKRLFTWKKSLEELPDVVPEPKTRKQSEDIPQIYHYGEDGKRIHREGDGWVQGDVV